MKILFLSLVFVGLFFCSSSKQALNDTDDAYKIINKYFKDKNKVLLNEKTVKINKDISALNNLRNWNEANYSIENAQRDEIDFTKVFTKDELMEITNFLQNAPTEELDKKKLMETITLYASDEQQYWNAKKPFRNISFPLLLKTKKGEKYGILYADYVNGIENGYGAIYIYKNTDKDWKLFFIYGLWIS